MLELIYTVSRRSVFSDAASRLSALALTVCIHHDSYYYQYWVIYIFVIHFIE